MSDEGNSRRHFLKVAGTAGVVAGCKPGSHPEKLIPYLIPPENIVPGTPLFYRTVCRECPAGCGVTARTREGRVIKLEGNPEDPIGGGALCAQGQAALQGLYSPARLKGPQLLTNGRMASLTWDQATKQLTDALVAARAKGPAAIRMLTRSEPGSAGELQRAFLKTLGANDSARVVLEPFDLPWLREASAILFGLRELPVFRLDQARMIVSFGADFLETWLSPVEHTRAFAQGRGRVGPERTELVWIGPRLSMTGASADRWLKARAGRENWVALGLLQWLLDPAHAVAGLAAEAPAIHRALGHIDPDQVARESGVAWTEIARVGQELSARRPSAVLGPGLASAGSEATRLAVLVQLINYCLGNVGHTVLHGLDANIDPPSSLAQVQSLVTDMAEGRVEILLVHNADLVGALPEALQATEALARVPLVVSLTARPDATSARAHLHLPDRHWLESFGDVTSRRGVTALAQPVMNALGDTRSASQVLLDVSAKVPAPAVPPPAQDLFDYLTSRNLTGRVDQERGGIYAEVAPHSVRLQRVDLASLLTRPPESSAPTSSGLSLVVFPTSLRRDGRNADLPWLREVPDPMTSVAWSSWAELSPVAAARLGVTTGDAVTVQTPTGKIELPTYVTPGLRDDVVAVPLGDVETLRLLPLVLDARSGGLAWVGRQAVVGRVGRRGRLPLAEGSSSEAGRRILHTVSAAAPTLSRPTAPPEMYPPPSHPNHRWAMSIDLDRCTGCQACVVACYAENNVPVVGAEAVAAGRSMAWLRIERYFRQEEKGELAALLLPMLCQQCSNAPCETVCPTEATYHTKEGLNAQVYNRCVGTRYCSNNCPYKVRTFNYKEPEFPTPLNLQLNPDVTVRSKGVMEKCTFCVQRIRSAENTARDDKRPMRDGDVTPACAQTCPAQAIVFGDENDPKSRVSRLQRDGRAYHVLEELNTLPAVTYLARVRKDDA